VKIDEVYLAARIVLFSHRARHGGVNPRYIGFNPVFNPGLSTLPDDVAFSQCRDELCNTMTVFARQNDGRARAALAVARRAATPESAIITDSQEHSR
jgi:hypothetical protein